ncbi:ArsR/SmtB family transcription factor [Streptomyces flavofungini]|uniref:ArsR/SmtB family transcription factor n=1 Tax=Streptomyces flavofungini TaxID=68200 RepID=UPI0025B04FEC|nr:winged helix-turn-helix domain-containing protein [Streptomyces flavofungini]WJV51699.1 winged helix-turn-helix domain-containing protein [Streptomyces flavofungini]
MTSDSDLARRVEHLEQRVAALRHNQLVQQRTAHTEQPPEQTVRLTLEQGDLHALCARLNALAHPVRLRILLACLNGTVTAAEFAARTDMGTTGQIYHHLRPLTQAGWLTSPRRGCYEMPPQAIQALAAALTACDGGLTAHEAAVGQLPVERR